MLAGGARLYGSEAFPSTLVMLASQKSLRILARVTVPPVLADHSSEAVFVAHAVLIDQTIGVVGGQISEDTKEIGSAVSPEYGSQIPSKSRSEFSSVACSEGGGPRRRTSGTLAPTFS